MQFYVDKKVWLFELQGCLFESGQFLDAFTDSDAP